MDILIAKKYIFVTWRKNDLKLFRFFFSRESNIAFGAFNKKQLVGFVLFGTDRYTRFIPKSDVKTLRKQWILSIKTKGKLKIDRGAIKALMNHKSLLPAGVIETFGNFERGDAVEIISKNNEKIGQGLSGYSSFDVQQIKGCKTNEIEKKLGHPGRVAMIHTDDLVLI